MNAQPRSGTMIVWLLAAGACIVAFGLGHCTRSAPSAAPAGQTVQVAATWTCSMHPQVRQAKPGKCPYCGMNLIPVETDQAASRSQTASLILSPEAAERAEVVTAPVERKFVPASIRLTGKVAYDETKLAHITTRVGGRLDKLYVDYTGIRVKKGDHLVYLYSQPLYVMQAEYLISRKSGETGAVAGRDRLLLAGLTEDQVKEIESTDTPQLYLTVYSPLSGTVIEKEGVEGMYIETGASIFTIADLSALWVLLDAYESDLPWIRSGQTASFTTEACPGTVFTGRVAFISPVLDEKTRTVNVRLNVDNRDGRLKPGFFVRATVHATVAGEGRVIEPALAGKWMCPMHPEIIRDAAASCPVCGMALVTVASLGYEAVETNTPPLVLPATAPLITGTRAVVYVATPGTTGAFEGREIVLGPRAGDWYIVRSGLAEGERVVVNGNVKIDSTLQIMAKPSMMNPPAESKAEPSAAPADPKALPAAVSAQLAAVFSAYSDLHRDLAADKFAEAKKAAGTLATKIAGVNASALDATWTAQATRLDTALKAIEAAPDIAKVRAQFKPLSDALIAVARKVGTGTTNAVYVIHCPMADGGKGADWLQTDKAVHNPYFGSGMPECGEVTETLGR